MRERKQKSEREKRKAWNRVTNNTTHFQSKQIEKMMTMRERVKRARERKKERKRETLNEKLFLKGF
jgi:hypothetical protein